MIDRAPRYSLRVSAEIEVGDEIFAGVTRNLSTGGVAVVLTRAVPKGTHLSVTLFAVQDGVESESAEGLTIDAEVRWVKEEIGGYSIGLQFGAMSNDKRRLLDRAIAVVGQQPGQGAS